MTGSAMQRRNRGKVCRREAAPEIETEIFPLPRTGAAYISRVASKMSCGRGVKAALWDRA
jgi:hypothetical protein